MQDIDPFVSATLLQQLLTFGLAFLAVVVAGRLFVSPVVGRLLRVRALPITLVRAVERVVRALTVLLAFSFAYNAAGFGNVITATATFAAALTIAVGFATRDIAGNLVNGVFIVTDPKFNIGDWIEWGSEEGTIEDIGFRVTRVRTFDGELVTVPNAQLGTSAVTNHSRNRHRVSPEFWIGYGDDVDGASAVLVEVARRHDGILDDPEPSARVLELNEDRVKLQARVWIARPTHAEFVRIRSEYLRRVKRRFREEGISLPPSW